MNQLPGWVQAVVVIIIFGAPALQKIYQLLARKAEQAQAEKRRQTQREEQLRTGHDPSAHASLAQAHPQPSHPQTVEDAALAARRRAQIEELRRRGRERTAKSPTPAQGSIPGSGGPTVLTRPSPRGSRPPSRVPQARPPTRPQPAPGARQGPASHSVLSGPRQAPPQMSRPAGSIEPLRPSPAEAKSEAQRPPPLSRLEIPSDRPVRGMATEPLAPRPSVRSGAITALGIGAGTAADWRRAIVMRELLAPPLSLRDPDAP